MKRHLSGLLVFSLIIGITFAAYAFVNSVSRTFDGQEVPPVAEVDVDRTGVIPVSAPKKYVARVVQYDQTTRRFTARLEVERGDIAARSAVEVMVAIDGSEPGFRSLYFQALGKVLPGSGEKAVLLIEQAVPSSLQLNSGTNHYAAFRIATNDDSLTNLVPGDFGPEIPIVFAHTKTSIRRGPVIIQ